MLDDYYLTIIKELVVLHRIELYSDANRAPALPIDDRTIMVDTIGIEPIAQCLQSIVAPLVHVCP
jgi:hypothetical protein